MLIIGHSLAEIVRERYLAYFAKKPAAAGWRRSLRGDAGQCLAAMAPAMRVTKGWPVNAHGPRASMPEFVGPAFHRAFDNDFIGVSGFVFHHNFAVALVLNDRLSCSLPNKQQARQCQNCDKCKSAPHKSSLEATTLPD